MKPIGKINNKYEMDSIVIGSLDGGVTMESFRYKVTIHQRVRPTLLCGVLQLPNGEMMESEMIQFDMNMYSVLFEPFVGGKKVTEYRGREIGPIEIVTGASHDGALKFYSLINMYKVHPVHIENIAADYGFPEPKAIDSICMENMRKYYRYIKKLTYKEVSTKRIAYTYEFADDEIASAAE